jgi:hypothetical protein
VSDDSISNHTPDGHVRCTVVDDQNDVICDETTSHAEVKTPGVHVAYIVYKEQTAYPSNLQGLLPAQVHGWTIVVTDGDGDCYSGHITDAEALEIRFNR